MKKTELTDFFLKAKQNSIEWTDNDFWELVSDIQRGFPELRLDFDYDSGEYWARILLAENETIIFIRYDFPLIIILEKWRDVMGKILSKNPNLVIVSVKDLLSERYSISPSHIPQIFPNNVWDPNLDPLDFSLGDLWWTTVV